MRIIGEVPHPKYKITVMKMNEKVTLQIEDRLLNQSFVFRDGSGISDFESASSVLTPKFLEGVDRRFVSMHKDYMEALEGMHQDEYDGFEII